MSNGNGSGNGQRSGRRRADKPSKLDKGVEDCLSKTIAMVSFSIYAVFTLLTLNKRRKDGKV